MSGIVEASDIPIAEKVYLRKDFLGWRVVHPIRNEDRSINWFNLIFGSKSNLVFLLIILLLGAGLYFGVTELLAAYKEVGANPCAFCTDCQQHVLSIINNMKISSYEFNFTRLNITI